MTRKVSWMALVACLLLPNWVACRVSGPSRTEGSHEHEGRTPALSADGDGAPAARPQPSTHTVAEAREPVPASSEPETGPAGPVLAPAADQPAAGPAAPAPRAPAPRPASVTAARPAASKPPAPSATPAPVPPAAAPVAPVEPPAAPAAAAASPAPAPPARYTGPDPCKLAVRGDSPVVRACQQGGIKEARKLMKDMVATGKRAGQNHKCDSCHPDDEYDKLTRDGRERFAKLLEVYAR